MDRTQIKESLVKNHQSFCDYLMRLNENQFLYQAKDKWSAGQQLDHILRATKPLVPALTLPKFVLKLLFGKANRPSRTYEDLVAKYHEKLKNGGKASGQFIPEKIAAGQREKLVSSVIKTVSTIASKLNRYSEDALDKFVLPHPLLGKLTLREMMYFTMYHVEHHLENIKHNLTLSNN